jgi:TonB family protein
MSNRSSIVFIALSVLAHVALFGLWPATEQTDNPNIETSIEIGMVVLPHVKPDFTIDRQRPNYRPSLNKRPNRVQEAVKPEIKPLTNHIHPETKFQVTEETTSPTPDKITDVIVKKFISPSIETNRSLQPDTSSTTTIKAAPLYSKNPAPDYPAKALRNGWEGEVWLKVVVSSSGSVEQISIERSSDYPILDQTAVMTVRLWQFEPARIGSEPTEGTIRIPIKFKIKRS